MLNKRQQSLRRPGDAYLAITTAELDELLHVGETGVGSGDRGRDEEFAALVGKNLIFPELVDLRNREARLRAKVEPGGNGVASISRYT